MYAIYSDESGCGENRYEAVGTLSIKESKIDEFRNGVREIQKTYNLGYLEYKKVRDDRRFDCSCKIIEYVIGHVLRGDAKLLVLVWDKHDSRHNVKMRDDHKNLSIMYYHALKNTKRLWFDSGLDSSFYPDQVTKLDFDNIIKYIENGRLIKDVSLRQSLFGLEFQDFFPTIINHEELDSKQDCLIQVIDIITGIVRLSYEEFDEYHEWCLSECAKNQQSLFPNIETNSNQISKSKISKYKLIQKIDSICKVNKLQVALKTTKSFNSHRPSCGVWFWKYVPQRDGDKAPQK